jgi:predicted metalloprotease
MQWRGRARSANVQDRRGRGGPIAAGGGVGLLIMLVFALITGTDPGVVLDQVAPGSSPEAGSSPAQDEQREFIEVVLGHTEQTWNELFAERGMDYPEPTLVLFANAVESACGVAGAQVGPFYCPGDRQVYLDLSFFEVLSQQLDAPGDFARAYVIAHEVGHHVQTVLGISDQVRSGQSSARTEDANALQVRMELQADCLAGVWGYHARQEAGFLEPGDLEEALDAAAAIGDDTLQRKSQGTVVPESFTHGTSRQRVDWFRRGFESGRLEQCDTFAAGTF